jgi:hypothetical protein
LQLFIVQLKIKRTNNFRKTTTNTTFTPIKLTPCFRSFNDGRFRNIKSGSDVSSIYIFPLQDAYGKTYGSGVVKFCHEKKDLEVDWIKWTHNRFLAIGAILAGFAEPEDGVLE